MKTFFARKTSRVSIPLGGLFVYLLLIQGALPSLVLCFGSGGHMAVEMPHSPVSHPTSQSQGPCLDMVLLLEKPEKQTRAMASVSASHALMPVLGHAAATIQWCTGPLSSDMSLYAGFSPLLPLAMWSPVILRI
jgi:hypothetical protein